MKPQAKQRTLGLKKAEWKKMKKIVISQLKLQINKFD